MQKDNNEVVQILIIAECTARHGRMVHLDCHKSQSNRGKASSTVTKHSQPELTGIILTRELLFLMAFMALFSSSKFAMKV